MSEDDNTNGADDSAYSSNLVINEDHSLTIPTSSSCVEMATNTIQSPARSPLHLVASTQSQTSTPMSHSCVHNSSDAVTETTVSSTNMIEYERLRSPESDAASNTSTARTATPPPFDNQPTDLSMNGATSTFVHVVSMPDKQQQPQSKHFTPDTSGLQLLSNSILAYEKNTFIKQEPIDRPVECSPQSAFEPVTTFRDSISTDTRRSSTESHPSFTSIPQEEESRSKEFVVSGTGEPLGGLNLLCALAEQRFQEEVGGSGSGCGSKRSSSSEASEPKRMKKHKEKHHTSKKSKKKERKEKKRQNSETIEDSSIGKDFKETFDRVKAKYIKCDCRKANTSQTTDVDCSCRSNNWLTPEQMYTAMKSEYRDRLAEIAREFQDKKRKLDAINSKEIRLQRESTPSSSKSSGSGSSKLSTTAPTLSPSILSSSSLDHCSSNGKAPSDSESCSSTSSKRKHFADVKNPFYDADVEAKKNKSLVGYIFASKKRSIESTSFSTADDASLNSEASTSTKHRIAAIKQETFEFDENSSTPEMNLFGTFAERKLTLAETMAKNEKLKHVAKHHKKTKNKEHKHHRRSTEIRERKRRTGHRCQLTDQHLDSLVDGKKMRVVTAMGGLFYAGCLSALQPPDVYAVTLDGERGNRPHIMSREEILRDAVSCQRRRIILIQ